MTPVAELLLQAGARKAPEMMSEIARIGKDFEFHRAGFSRDLLDETDVALRRLYSLFDVTPIAVRSVYDGSSPIVVEGARWQDRHEALWQLLVPSSGAAATVQGEVVRISGRIHIELEENGGVNWDAAFMKMADAFLRHISSEVALAAPLLAETRALVESVKRKRGDALRLCELAVEWVALNPTPVRLPPPDYLR